MNTFKRLIEAVVLVVAVSSCSSNFLNVTPQNQISSASVWTSSQNADLFLNGIYNDEPDFRSQGWDLISHYTGYSYVGAEWMPARQVVYPGGISPENTVNGPGNSNYIGGRDHIGGGMWDWSAEYSRIRECNIFIQNVEQSTDIPQSYKEQRIPEARFLRALFYSWLWENYGGVPIIKIPLDNQTQGNKIFRPRATEKATFQFIDDELTAIADSLPTTQGAADVGRPTKGAALTLKAWVELNEASPLFNPSNDKTLWQNAADAYKKVMDMGVYSLDPNFNDLWDPSTQASNPELIFQREYTTAKGGYAEGYRGVTMQGGVETGWGNWTPTQNLVDKFDMSNGKMISDPNSGYDPQNPYKNRSQRFYDSIIYNGSVWQGDTVWTQMGGNNQIDLGSQSDITNTGYYTRKYMDKTVSEAANVRNGKSPENYIYFRYAGVLLGYAEAENEANGPVASVYSAVDQVRARVGLPTIEQAYGGSVTQSKMRDIIHNEWATEFCFEDKSWYNLRRWKDLAWFNSPIYAMQITPQSNGTKKYQQVKIADRSWHAYQFLMPIPHGVLVQNSAMLKQNGGADNWNNGQNPGY